MKKLALASVAASFVICSGLPTPAMSVEPVDYVRVVGWGGLYAGGYFGAGQGDVRTTFDDWSTFTSRDVNQGLNFTNTFTNSTMDWGWGSGSGNIAGAQADLFFGYNLPVGRRFMVGLQAEGTPWSTYTLDTDGRRDAKSETVNTNTNATTTTDRRTGTSSSSINFSDDLESMVGLVGRAGVLVLDDQLYLYGIGGVVWGNFTLNDVAGLGGLDRQILNDRQVWEAGHTLGFGGELKLWDHVSIRGEYRFYHWEYNRKQTSWTTQTNNFTNSSSTSTSDFARNWSNDVDLHTGKIGFAVQLCGLVGRC